MKKKLKPLDLGICILFLILLMAIGLIITLNFRTLYYFDIDYLNISSQSGLTKEVIRENYDALMDYCSPFFNGSLNLPSLPSSPAGLQHFKETKDIFNIFYILGLLSLILLIILVRYKNKKKDYHFLKISGIGVLVLPIITGIGISLNFNASFELFHKLFFRNDYWIFTPQDDPIITILPETYFLHCAFIIIGVIVIGSILLLFLHQYYKNKYKNCYHK